MSYIQLNFSHLSFTFNFLKRALLSLDELIASELRFNSIILSLSLLNTNQTKYQNRFKQENNKKTFLDG